MSDKCQHCEFDKPVYGLREVRVICHTDAAMNRGEPPHYTMMLCDLCSRGRTELYDMPGDKFQQYNTNALRAAIMDVQR